MGWNFDIPKAMLSLEQFIDSGHQQRISIALEWLSGFKGEALKEQSEIDSFIAKFYELANKLSDKDVTSLFSSIKIRPEVTRNLVKAYHDSIDAGISLWKTVVPPIFNALLRLSVDDVVKRTDAFMKTKPMIDEANKKFFARQSISGFSFLSPKWSSTLASEIKNKFATIMKNEDGIDVPMSSVGWSSKQDLLLIADTLKDGFALTGKCSQFKKYIKTVVQSDKLEKLYRDSEIKSGRNTDTNDLDYGIQHYGVVCLWSGALDTVTYRSVLEYMYGPDYFDDYACIVAKATFKKGTSLLGRIFGK